MHHRLKHEPTREGPTGTTGTNLTHVETRTTDAVSLLSRVDEMVAAGRSEEALGLVAAENRRRRDPMLERELVMLRHRSFQPRTEAVPAHTPVTASDPSDNLLEIEAPELDLEVLRSHLSIQGCVLVRGLLERQRALDLAAGIDHALEAFDAYGGEGSEDDEGWYFPFTPDPGRYRVGGRRKWVRASGAVWTADSPRMLASLTDLLTETGIGELVTEYLGERPALSANKCTLRRVPLDTNVGWHQDGAFLGQEVRTLNLWLALGDCGTDAPGLDLVPRRFDEVLPSGTEGAMFDWSVAPDVVERSAGSVGIVRPEFRAGDALLFDHLFLHSTAVEPTMTRERHAMETWFFAPSAYPDGQIPLAF